MVTKEKLLQSTRGGLDIILDLYPQAARCVEDKKFKFKKRPDENTPSAHIIERDGIWYLKDFGEGGKGKNGIGLWMEARGMDRDRFGEACLQIARRFGVTDELDKSVNFPRFVKRAATPDEREGEVVFELKDRFSEEELRLLGPKVTQDTVEQLNWHSVEWIGRAKNRHITEKHSTDSYPIFIRQCVVPAKHAGEKERIFYKQYEPKNPEKGFRFVYFPTGGKEPDYINGLWELQKEHARYVEEQRVEWENSHRESEPFNEHRCKLPEVVLCSGERDALCVRSLGYCPVWLNSETAMLSSGQVATLSRYAETIYNIPDIDATGRRAGRELALRHIDIYTAWLPERLTTYRDHRGKQRKDLRDWCDLRPTRQDFRQLLMRAKPAKFWTAKAGKDGTPRYDLDTEYLFYFLQLNGFYILHDENSKDPRFVRIQDNVVEAVTTRDIRAFLIRWAQNDETTQHHNVRNLILNSPRLSSVALEALAETECDFTCFSSTSQDFFFSNGVVRVTATGLDFYDLKRSPLDTFVWKEQVLPWMWRKKEEPFRWEVATGDDMQPRVRLTLPDVVRSKFFCYLINSSRLYWRKEMEEAFGSDEERLAYRELHRFTICGEGLTPKERDEQEQNLASKLFCLGYILHQYKNPSRAWALMSMDSKIGESDECNGGSGKSLFYQFLRRLRNLEHKSGRSGDLTKNQFWAERVTQFTQILEIDDMDERMPASFFYDFVTGPMEINPKNNRSFVLPFEQSPKMGFSTNYVPYDFDPSSERRLLYMVYSDYYHQQSLQTDYRETRTVASDFGKNLFDPFYTEDEWLEDVSFAMHCVRFYLWLADRHPSLKPQPPMENIRTRKLKRDMGENFEEWAYQYFAEDGPHLDCQIVRSEAFEDFRRYSGVTGVKMKSFSRKLRAFADVCPYVFEIDPEDYRNSQGRNISYEEDPLDQTKKKTVEMVYLRSVKGEAERRRQVEAYGDEPF